MICYTPPGSELPLTDRKVWRLARLSDGKIEMQKRPQDVDTLIEEMNEASTGEKE